MGDAKDLRIFNRTVQCVGDIANAASELHLLAREDPMEAFDAALTINKPGGYAILAEAYRLMIEKGEGDQELVANLWDKCLARSAGHLGIEFSEEKAPKMRAVYKRHPGVPRARGPRAVYRSPKK